VTTLGTNVDGRVRRLGASYEVRGLPRKLTSYDAATGGNIVNEVQFEYNDFRQVIKDYQSHAGAVVAGGFNSSPFVTYGYADGSANTIRPTGITYPNGREIEFAYGSPGTVNDAASRIGTIAYGQGLVEETHYEYLGLGTIVEADHWQPSLRFTLVGTDGGDDPDTGDIYRGLDRFGRVKDLVWRDDGTNSDAVRIQHGYDRASNRLWRKDPVAASFGKRFDELYTYDGLYRLATMQRGTLNGGHTAVTNSTFAQCWSLDETGNWHEMRQDDTGAGSWDLVQTRTANPVNEITAITNSTGPTWAQPAYDAAGNMTTIPTGNAPGWSDLSVADWSGLSPDGWATMPLLGGPDSYTATYDAWNRLVTLTDGANTIQENEYDPRAYRTVRKRYVGGVLDETRHYYYSTDWQVLEERLGTDPISAGAERQFVWGLRYIDDLVRRDRDTNADGTLDERLYALQDPNWNVVAIADTAGDVQERFAYSAYGVPLVLGPAFGSRQDSSFVWERLYAGYQYDGYVYMVRARPLQPLLGAWIQRDPLGYVDGQNLYSYTASVGTTDATGTFGGNYNLHHIVGEWYAKYTNYGPRSQGFRILLSRDFHVALERSIRPIWRAFGRGEISQWTAYNRALLAQIRMLPRMLADSRAAAAATGGSMYAWHGGARAAAAQLGYRTLGQAAMGAAGVGAVAGGAVIIHSMVHDILASTAVANATQMDIDFHNALIRSGKLRAGVVVNDVLSSLKKLTVCPGASKGKANRCFDSFRTGVEGKGGGINVHIYSAWTEFRRQGLVSTDNPTLSLHEPAVRAAWMSKIEHDFKKLVACMDAAGCVPRGQCSKPHQKPH